VPRTIERIRGEFLEMPGLRLTAAQVARLCGLDRTNCQGVLDALVDARFLRVSTDGTYTRLIDGKMTDPRPAAIDHAQAGNERRRTTA
jgi:hypothetical protein